MGNQCSIGNRVTTIKKKLQRRKMVKISHDHSFVMQYFGDIKLNHIADLDSLLKRHVFVSLIGLYQTWKQCPPVILYPSILIMPLKSDWIYHPSDHKNDPQFRSLSEISLFSDTVEREQFLELLKFKDSQGLVFWSLDSYDTESDDSPMIHPFWHRLSDKLKSLPDAVSRRTCNGINMDAKWWQNKQKYISKYGVGSSKILSEFYFFPSKFKSIQEILHQSNPNSLVPVISYQSSTTSTIQNENMDLYDEFDDDDDLDNWWLSPDYDPYDVDNDFLRLEM